MARFRKDILALGHWVTNTKVWHVTRDVLSAIVDDFNLWQSRENSTPLQWNHSNDSRDRAGDILALSTDGERLWADILATDPQAESRLGRVNQEVSVQILENWVDGKGHEYRYHLNHVGIVNQPVVSGQGPFMRLSLAERGDMSKTIVHNLQTGAEETGNGEGGGANDAATDASGSETTVSVADVLEMLKQFFGFEPPEGVEIKTANDLRIAIGSAASKMAGATPDDPEISEGKKLSLNPEQEAEFNRLKRINREQAIELSKSRATHQRDRKAMYLSRAMAIQSSGRCGKEQYDMLLQQGEEHGWSLSLLTPWEMVPARPELTMGKMYDHNASATPPPVGSQPAPQQYSDEECKAEAAKFI